jgi:hypothetical protein
VVLVCRRAILHDIEFAVDEVLAQNALAVDEIEEEAI